MLAELETRLGTGAQRGLVAALGADAKLSSQLGQLAGSVVTGGGCILGNVDNACLAPFDCGAEHGLLFGVLTGNYKDEGCGVASAIAALALLEEFAPRLTSSADIVPALRRAAIAAHQRIFAAKDWAVAPDRFRTVMGKRRDLRAIGCSLTAVAVRSSELHGIHVGEGRAFLIRNGATKKLTIEHTLNHDPNYRESVRRNPADACMAPELVIMHALGVSEKLPRMDVFKLELFLHDAIVIGNLALSPACFEHAQSGHDPYRSPRVGASELVASLAETMAERSPNVPSTVGVVELLSAGSEQPG